MCWQKILLQPGIEAVLPHFKDPKAYNCSSQAPAALSPEALESWARATYEAKDFYFNGRAFDNLGSFLENFKQKLWEYE